MFCTIDSPTAVFNQPPAPTQGTCSLLALYSTTFNNQSYGLTFSCTPVQSPPMQHCVMTCAKGSFDINQMCAVFSSPENSRAMFNAIGYRDYSCNLFSHVNTSCGCLNAYFSPQCSAIPSPSPPPPPPPSPPPPTPPPPPPACEICTMFCTVDLPGVNAPPAPTQGTCSMLALYSTSYNREQNLTFACVPYNDSPPGRTCVMR